MLHGTISRFGLGAAKIVQRFFPGRDLYLLSLTTATGESAGLYREWANHFVDACHGSLIKH
jgi:hypothetical protein